MHWDLPAISIKKTLIAAICSLPIDFVANVTVNENVELK